MSAHQELKNTIHQILKHNRDGSFATQADRKQILKNFANELVGLGYKLPDIKNLKEKHILAMVKHWQAKQLAVSTIKNRMSVLRHICEKINRTGIVPSNDALQIGKRCYVPQRNRAIFNANFENIKHPYVRISLELQKAFGLRREESLKICPHMADKGDKLELLPPWCKGGRGRTLPIRTEEQRYWLDQAKELVEKFGHSLIPQNKNYIQHRWVYDKQIRTAGFRNLHGLRHAYAQSRYKELTGWEAPINGGPKAIELTLEQKEMDHRARMILSEELGHSREQITVNYLGR